MLPYELCHDAMVIILHCTIQPATGHSAAACSSASNSAALHAMHDAAGLAPLIAQHGPPERLLSKSSSCFVSLAKSILYQQLAGSAAAAIYSRFLAVCGVRACCSTRILCNASGVLEHRVGLYAAAAAVPGCVSAAAVLTALQFILIPAVCHCASPTCLTQLCATQLTLRCTGA